MSTTQNEVVRAVRINYDLQTQGTLKKQNEHTEHKIIYNRNTSRTKQIQLIFLIDSWEP